MRKDALITRSHYAILDGLRGVASVMVVAFHIFEAHATNHFDQVINHGYLAVDFFFVLSGFVIGYAYDDRWTKMSVKEFFKLRLARLQPMIVPGNGCRCLVFLFPGFGNVAYNTLAAGLENAHHNVHRVYIDPGISLLRQAFC